MGVVCQDSDGDLLPFVLDALNEVCFIGLCFFFHEIAIKASSTSVQMLIFALKQYFI